MQRSFSANKKGTFVYQKFLFVYPSRKLGISSRRSRGYHQGRQAALVSHHAPACICLRLDDIPQQVADDIQGLRLDFDARMCYYIPKEVILCRTSIKEKQTRKRQRPSLIMAERGALLKAQVLLSLCRRGIVFFTYSNKIFQKC